MYGDMGNKNARSLARLQEEAQKGHFDMVLHVGDFAYNMDWVSFVFCSKLWRRTR